jgi:hypothetical protein
MSEPAVESRFAESDAVVEWCLRNALRMERLGELERAGLWAYVAAGTAAEYGHSYLCSAALESLLVRIGARVAARGSRERTAGAPPGSRWLHVFSVTLAIGGHTALVRRWATHNPFGERHSVALTVQTAADVAPELAAAVARTGGSVHSVAGAGSLFERASALRRLASDEADVVVLHVHPWDVLPAIAFAGADGPPVLLMNHADHAFWVGAAVADVVVDIRDSGRALSTSYRGARRSVVLPLPLEDRGPAPRTCSVAGQRLGDPTALERGLVLLTIGSPHKYRPAGRLDFAATSARILEAVPDSVLVAVGPDSSDPAWRQLGERTTGRVVAVGPDADLAPWHAAADLYLEGFPIGSYTALLEVALAERAFVRKPLLAPVSALPVDRGALGAFEPPDDPDAYVAAAIALAADSDLRAARARTARSAVLAEHCGDGWTARLDALRRAIPRQHSVGFGFSPSRMPEPMAAYWAGVLARASGPRPLDYAAERARENGLRPRLDVAVLDAMRRRAV